MTKQLKIYGLPRSGTNYLARLIELNFPDVRVWHHHKAWRGDGDHGDKHGPPVELPDMDGYLLIAKGPVSWVASMLRYRPAAVSGLMARWNAWMRAAVAFEPGLWVQRIEYQDLLRYGATKELCAWISGNPYLSGGSRWLTEPNVMLRGGDNMRGDAAVGRTKFDPSYYLERKYAEGMAGQMLALIDEQHDADAWAAFCGKTPEETS